MHIQHVERDWIFIELPGRTDADVIAAWQSAFGDLVAEIGHRTVIIEAPAGWYTAGAGGTKRPVRLRAFTPGEAITAAAIENQVPPAPWIGRVAVLLIAAVLIFVIARGL